MLSGQLGPTPAVGILSKDGSSVNIQKTTTVFHSAISKSNVACKQMHK